MDMKKNKQLTLDANLLLDAEMQTINGGATTDNCITTHEDRSTIQAPWGGCSSCNKTQSCQTHT
jgi:hypothetical protein